ncbi:L-threonylcarbamoyladenylate synthase [Mycoplasma sp. E35C]|uniref:L-threonylcarbamoyladenylate synthase n=1 Tax=Mycoplasma sp. E35C TaxID=2801918 RepID=UPI001CA3EE75|nr:L-threonylcarbamoyladenylate synthase [Mycoplasma sp. E35C]QZX49254.1 L-threonylcarbamoyladenylate synthase [Mycoplasma sp. E35C]
MIILDIKKDLDEIVKAINSDKLLIVPTDTLYGVVCKNKDKIYELKKRDLNKKLIYFCSDIYQTGIKDELFLKLANKFWPGKLTLILDGVSYRIPNQPEFLKILKIVGKIYSSSANISNHEPYKTWQEYANDEYFKNQKDLVLIKGSINSSTGSTIYDLDKKQILREGDLTNELKQYLLTMSINS